MGAHLISRGRFCATIIAVTITIIFVFTIIIISTIIITTMVGIKTLGMGGHKKHTYNLDLSP